MKNSKLAKLVLVVLMVVMIACVGVEVFAADSNSSYEDLQSVLSGTGNNTTNNTTNNTVNNTTNNTLNTSGLTNNTTNNIANTNTTLPKTGIASSTSVIVLITICGISAIYAYNKIRDYKNL